MKEKILAALKTKYASKGFSTRALEGFADYLTPGIDDDSKIEGAITGMENLLAAFQSEIDRRVNEARTKPAQTTEPAPGADTKPGGNPDDQMPAWAKSLLEQNQQLVQKIGQLESEQTGRTLMQQLRDTMTQKGIPEQYYQVAADGRTFTKPEELTAFVNKIENSYQQFSQMQIDKGLVQQTRPPMGTPDPKTGVSHDTKEYVKVKFGKEAGEAVPLEGKKI